MTKREQILVALHQVLVAAEASLTRNAPLAELAGGKLVTLRDGEIELTDEFFNGPDDSIYEFTMSPNVILIVEKGASPNTIDALLDAEIETLNTACAGAGSLGGLITALRVQPADMAPHELFGIEDKKGAEIAIEIDYWSAQSVG